jgi:hypothetical protein
VRTLLVRKGKAVALNWKLPQGPASTGRGATLTAPGLPCFEGWPAQMEKRRTWLV